MRAMEADPQASLLLLAPCETVTIGGSKEKLLAELDYYRIDLDEAMKAYVHSSAFLVPQVQVRVALAEVEVRHLGFDTPPTVLEVWQRIPGLGHAHAPVEAGLRRYLSFQTNGPRDDGHEDRYFVTEKVETASGGRRIANFCREYHERAAGWARMADDYRLPLGAKLTFQFRS